MEKPISWFALRGALYSYDLVPTGGYYGAIAALAPKLSVQLDTVSPNRQIYIVNKSPDDERNVFVTVKAYALKDSHSVSSETYGHFDVSSSTSLPTGATWAWPDSSAADDALLVRLYAGTMLPHANEYLFSNGEILSFELPDAHATLEVTWDGAAIRVQNTNSAVAVSVSLDIFLDGYSSINDGKDAEGCRDVDPRLADAVMSDNYFHLIAGEARTISIRFIGESLQRLPSGARARAAALNAPLDAWSEPLRLLLTK